MTQGVPWTTARIWTTSAVIAVVPTVVGVLASGDPAWIPLWVPFSAVALWVVERVAGKANAAAAEQAAAEREAVAEQVLAKREALERSASERAAAAVQEAVAVRAAEHARVAAAEQAADQILFDDLVQEAHRQMAKETSGE